MLLLTASVGYAGKIKIGQPLPEVYLHGSAGELLNVGKQVNYRYWSADSLVGKVRTVYHLAARWRIDEINKKYIDAVNREKFPAKKYKTLTILNIDDVFVGGSAMARDRFEDSRREHPEGEFVIDDSSRVREAWGIEKRGSAVIVVGKDGKVLAFNDGPLTDDAIKLFIDVIKANM
jgi:uncharacterized protein